MTVGSKVRCGEGGAVWKVRSGRWAGAGRGKTLRLCKGRLDFILSALGSHRCDSLSSLELVLFIFARTLMCSVVATSHVQLPSTGNVAGLN